MRILYLTESMGWSGGAQQALWMAGALQKNGHEVVLACQPGSDIEERAREAGLPIEHVRMRQDYDVPAAVTVGKLLRRHRTEVLHAQHSTAHALGLMAAAWIRGPAFIVTRRVTFPMRRNLFSRLKYLSKRINGYVAISRAVKDQLLNAGIEESRIEVIPSVVRLEPAGPADGAAVRQELGLGKGPVILTVANYASFKGQDFLVKAAAKICSQFPDAEFLLAGRGTEALESLVRELGLKGRVILAGFRTDVPRLLAAADLFVLPSLEEAAGTALREAMLAGLPAIGTNVGGIPESIDDGENGLLVPPSDSGALAEKITRLLSNAEERKRFGERGRARMVQEFSLEGAAQRMERFYHQVLSR